MGGSCRANQLIRYFHNFRLRQATKLKESKFQFKQLLVNSPMAKEYLQKEVTIFAPSDAYMEKYDGPKDEQFILNHIGTLGCDL